MREGLDGTGMKVLRSREEAIIAARQLRPELLASAADMDARRGMSAAMVTRLRDSGILSVVQPRRFGGSELGFAALLETAMEIGAASGSAGWLTGVYAGHNWIMALFPEAAQCEIFGQPGALVSSVTRLSGTAAPVEGGYWMEAGEGRFSSGVDHADWLIVGNPVRLEEGRERQAFLLVPRSAVEVVDDWFTIGMRGTGSRSVKLSNIFVPAHRLLWIDEMNAGTAPGSMVNPGPLFRVPGLVANALALAGAVLGVAREAVAQYGAAVDGKLATSAADQMAEASGMILRLSEVEAEAAAARALVLRDAEMMDGDHDGLTEANWMAVRRNIAWAAQRSRHVVNRLFEASGGSGIYDAAPLQRLWRDINAGAAHFAFSRDNAAIGYARLRASRC